MRRRFAAVLVAAATFASLACQSEKTEVSEAPAETSEPLLVYSGRGESLVGPLLQRFEEATGLTVETRYGDTSEMAATLLEEGARSPADLFLSQDAAALGALSAAGLLRPLPASVSERVPATYRSAAGDWVGLSGRARSVVYNTGLTTPDALPRTLDEVTDPRFRGRFGVAPVNGSFQAHMAAYLAVEGAEKLGTLLAGMTANEPLRYPKNSAIVEAVIAGEIDWGLVNHYYLWRALAENPEAPAANRFMVDGSVSGFVNLAGAGLVSDRPEALELLEFLLSDEAQRYFADTTFEYPLVPGIPAASGLTPLAEVAPPKVDFTQVAAVLEETLGLINQSGLVE